MSPQKLSQTQRIKQLDPQTPPTRFTTSGWQLWDLRIKHANYVQSITINHHRDKNYPFSRCSKIMHTNCKPKTIKPQSLSGKLFHTGKLTSLHLASTQRKSSCSNPLQLHCAQTRRMAVLGKKCTLEVADIFVRITKVFEFFSVFCKRHAFLQCMEAQACRSLT